jgi:hypothetical protein
VGRGRREAFGNNKRQLFPFDAPNAVRMKTVRNAFVPHSSPDFLHQHRLKVISPLKITGGEGGIRTLGRDLNPYNALAKRRYRPLSHLSGSVSPRQTRRNESARRISADSRSAAEERKKSPARPCFSSRLRRGVPIPRGTPR